MTRFLTGFTLFFCLPLFSVSQRITYSDPLREDVNNMNFEIIGKINNNILVFKNLRFKYAVAVYSHEMQLLDKVQLDFLPDRTYNVDFVTFPGFFYLFYQFQKKGIVHCMAVKMNSDGKKVNEPVELDTTQIGIFGDNKIYNAIYSEDRSKIMVFKMQKKNSNLNFVTLLFDDTLKLLHKSRYAFPYEDNRDIYSDFLLDNEGKFIFANSRKSANRDYINYLGLVTKPANSDTFTTRELDLKDKYIDEAMLKVDNVNKHSIVNAYYYRQKRGSIEGIYYNIWDNNGDSSIVSAFQPLNDSIRSIAKTDKGTKYAFDDFFIRNVIVKKDGGYILMAEDNLVQTRSGSYNRWNRWDYLYNSAYVSPYDYYRYYPTYNMYYRPFNSFNTYQSSRYYCNNVLVVGIDKTGKFEWTSVVHKDQFDDISDNYLSFATFITGGEIHFLFNEMEKRQQLLSDNSITASGKLKRNPTLRSLDKGYQFMPKFGKQVGPGEIIIPCTYRNLISFARIEY